MGTIIAGKLQLQEQAEETIKQLLNAGFTPEKVTSFYVNPPGQHALYPIGGDRYQSPDIEEMDESIESGIGTIALTEAILGAENNEHSNDSSSHSSSLRRAGMLIAVELTESAQEKEVIHLFKQCGVKDIERAQGEIINKEWTDFDPLSSPCYL